MRKSLEALGDFLCAALIVYAVMALLYELVLKGVLHVLLTVFLEGLT